MERAREKKKLTNHFVIPERNVGLKVIHYEGIGAEVLRREGVSAAEGRGALEGSWEGGFTATSDRRGCFLPHLP